MWPGLATSNYGGLWLQESVFVWPRGHRWQACACSSTTRIINQIEIKSFVVRQKEFWTAKGWMSSLVALKDSSSICVAQRPHILLLDNINVLNLPNCHCLTIRQYSYNYKSLLDYVHIGTKYFRSAAPTAIRPGPPHIIANSDWQIVVTLNYSRRSTLSALYYK